MRKHQSSYNVTWDPEILKRGQDPELGLHVLTSLRNTPFHPGGRRGYEGILCRTFCRFHSRTKNISARANTTAKLRLRLGPQVMQDRLERTLDCPPTQLFDQFACQNNVLDARRSKPGDIAVCQILQPIVQLDSNRARQELMVETSKRPKPNRHASYFFKTR